MLEIVVVGGGGHAKVLIGALKKIRQYRPIGYTALEDAGLILGVPFLGDDRTLVRLVQESDLPNAVIAVGHTGLGDKREAIQKMLEELGYRLPVIVSSTAVVSENVSIAKGTFIGDRVIVNPDSRIGECVILNTGCIVEHDCTVEDLVHVAPGATLGGGVHVGRKSLIGLGASVLPYVTITANTIIGGGATVVRDIDQPGVYVGNPARKTR